MKKREHSKRKESTWTLKFNASITLVCFLFSGLPAGRQGFAWPSTSFAGLADSQAFLTEAKDYSHLSIPPELGTIRERFSPPDAHKKPFVVYIQDAHAVYDAQKSIQGIIGHLQKEFALPLVAIEGAVGELDPVLFRAFPVTSIREKTFDELMHKGEISGADAAAILNPSWSEFVGIEDEAIYMEDRAEFIAALKKKDEALKILDEQVHQNDQAKAKLYSPELLELDRKYEAFQENPQELMNLLTLLVRYDPPATEFPKLSLLLKEVNRQNHSQEHQSWQQNVLIMKFAGKVKTQLKGDEMKEYAKAYQAHQKNTERGQFVEFLWKKAREKGIPTRGFIKILRSERKEAKLKSASGEEVYQELATLARREKEELFSTPQEKELDQAAHQFKLLRKLISLELSREELHEIQTAALPQEPSLSERIRPAQRFYELALQRDKVLYEKLIEETQKHRAPVVAAVTGGFHAEGVTALLKEKGFPYVLITPKIYEVGESGYLDVMLGKNLSYKKYLEPSASVQQSKIALMDLIAPDMIGKAEWEAVKQAWSEQMTQRVIKENEEASMDELMGRWLDSIVSILLQARSEKSSVDYEKDIKAIHQKFAPQATEALSDEAQQKVKIEQIINALNEFFQDYKLEIRSKARGFFDLLSQNNQNNVDTALSLLDYQKPAADSVLVRPRDAFSDLVTQELKPQAAFGTPQVQQQVVDIMKKIPPETFRKVADDTREKEKGLAALEAEVKPVAPTATTRAETRAQLEKALQKDLPEFLGLPPVVQAGVLMETLNRAFQPAPSSEMASRAEVRSENQNQNIFDGIPFTVEINGAPNKPVGAHRVEQPYNQRLLAAILKNQSFVEDSIKNIYKELGNAGSYSNIQRVTAWRYSGQGQKEIFQVIIEFSNGQERTVLFMGTPLAMFNQNVPSALAAQYKKISERERDYNLRNQLDPEQLQFAHRFGAETDLDYQLPLSDRTSTTKRYQFFSLDFHPGVPFSAVSPWLEILAGEPGRPELDRIGLANISVERAVEATNELKKLGVLSENEVKEILAAKHLFDQTGKTNKALLSPQLDLLTERLFSLDESAVEAQFAFMKHTLDPSDGSFYSQDDPRRNNMIFQMVQGKPTFRPIDYESMRLNNLDSPKWAIASFDIFEDKTQGDQRATVRPWAWTFDVTIDPQKSRFFEAALTGWGDVGSKLLLNTYNQFVQEKDTDYPMVKYLRVFLLNKGILGGLMMLSASKENRLAIRRSEVRTKDQNTANLQEFIDDIRPIVSELIERDYVQRSWPLTKAMTGITNRRIGELPEILSNPKFESISEAIEVVDDLVDMLYLELIKDRSASPKQFFKPGEFQTDKMPFQPLKPSERADFEDLVDDLKWRFYDHDRSHIPEPPVALDFGFSKDSVVIGKKTIPLSTGSADQRKDAVREVANEINKTHQQGIHQSLAGVDDLGRLWIQYISNSKGEFEKQTVDLYGDDTETIRQFFGIALPKTPRSARAEPASPRLRSAGDAATKPEGRSRAEVRASEEGKKSISDQIKKLIQDLDQKQILQLHLDPALENFRISDPNWERLKVILREMITNALTFSEGKPVEISAEIEGEQVHFQIVDHGKGMDANTVREQARNYQAKDEDTFNLVVGKENLTEINKLLEKNEPLTNADLPKMLGRVPLASTTAGLGFIMASRFAHELGGTFDVQSVFSPATHPTENSGTTVSIRLPKTLFIAGGDISRSEARAVALTNQEIRFIREVNGKAKNYVGEENLPMSAQEILQYFSSRSEEVLAAMRVEAPERQAVADDLEAKADPLIRDAAKKYFNEIEEVAEKLTTSLRTERTGLATIKRRVRSVSTMFSIISYPLSKIQDPDTLSDLRLRITQFRKGLEQARVKALERNGFKQGEGTEVINSLQSLHESLQKLEHSMMPSLASSQESTQSAILEKAPESGTQQISETARPNVEPVKPKPLFLRNAPPQSFLPWLVWAISSTLQGGSNKQSLILSEGDQVRMVLPVSARRTTPILIRMDLLKEGFHATIGDQGVPAPEKFSVEQIDILFNRETSTLDIINHSTSESYFMDYTPRRSEVRTSELEEMRRDMVQVLAPMVKDLMNGDEAAQLLENIHVEGFWNDEFRSRTGEQGFLALQVIKLAEKRADERYGKTLDPEQRIKDFLKALQVMDLRDVHAARSEARAEKIGVVPGVSNIQQKEQELYDAWVGNSDILGKMISKIELENTPPDMLHGFFLDKSGQRIQRDGRDAFFGIQQDPNNLTRIINFKSDGISGYSQELVRVMLLDFVKNGFQEVKISLLIPTSKMPAGQKGSVEFWRDSLKKWWSDGTPFVDIPNVLGEEFILPLQSLDLQKLSAPSEARAMDEAAINRSDVRSLNKTESVEGASGALFEARAVHVNVPYRKSSLDFILDKRMVHQLNQLGISPEDFIGEVLKEIENDLSLFPLKSKLLGSQRWGGRVKPIEVFSNYDETKNLSAAVSPNIAKLLLMREVFDEIARKKTILETVAGNQDSEAIDYGVYYRGKFSEHELYEALEGTLLTKLMISNEIGDRIAAAVFRDKERIKRFQNFVSVNRDRLDVRSTRIALETIFYNRQLLDEKDIDHALEKEIARLKKLEDQLYELSRPLANSESTDEEIVAAAKKVLAVNPNDQLTRSQLEHAEERIKKEEEKKQKQEEARRKAVRMEGRSVDQILHEVESAIVSQDRAYALELLRIAANRDGLTLEEINTVLALLPLASDSYAEAGKILGPLTVKYRHGLVNLVLEGQGLSPTQKEILAGIYVRLFSNGIVQRKESIRANASLSNLEDEKIDTIEKALNSAKERMRAATIEINNRLYSHTQPEVKVDIRGKTLEQLLLANQSADLDTQLKIASAYFQIIYGISLVIPFEEETDLTNKPRGPRMNDRVAILYSKREIESLLAGLKKVDGWLSSLPAEVILKSMSFQKFLIVKNMRASYSHSESLKENKINLALEAETPQITLYHELGHSLHGPDGDFAAYVNPQRLTEIILKYQEDLKSTDPALMDLAQRGEITETNRSKATWDAFQALFNIRLKRWLAFNQRIGVSDLNAPIKPERTQEKLIEEYGQDGISPVRKADQPSLTMSYIFEEPFEDKFGRGELTRKEPIELIAEYTQLFITHPKALKKFDPPAFDLLESILGEVQDEKVSRSASGPVGPQARGEARTKTDGRSQKIEVREINGESVADVDGLANSQQKQKVQSILSEPRVPYKSKLGSVPQTFVPPLDIHSIEQPNQKEKTENYNIPQHEVEQSLSIKNQRDQSSTQNSEQDLRGVLPSTGVKLEEFHGAKNSTDIINSQEFINNNEIISRSEARTKTDDRSQKPEIREKETEAKSKTKPMDKKKFEKFIKKTFSGIYTEKELNEIGVPGFLDYLNASTTVDPPLTEIANLVTGLVESYQRETLTDLPTNDIEGRKKQNEALFKDAMKNLFLKNRPGRTSQAYEAMLELAKPNAEGVFTPEILYRAWVAAALKAGKVSRDLSVSDAHEKLEKYYLGLNENGQAIVIPGVGASPTLKPRRVLEIIKNKEYKNSELFSTLRKNRQNFINKELAKQKAKAEPKSKIEKLAPHQDGQNLFADLEDPHPSQVEKTKNIKSGRVTSKQVQEATQFVFSLLQLEESADEKAGYEALVYITQNNAKAQFETHFERILEGKLRDVDKKIDKVKLEALAKDLQRDFSAGSIQKKLEGLGISVTPDSAKDLSKEIKKIVTGVLKGVSLQMSTLNEEAVRTLLGWRRFIPRALRQLWNRLGNKMPAVASEPRSELRVSAQVFASAMTGEEGYESMLKEMGQNARGLVNGSIEVRMNSKDPAQREMRQEIEQQFQRLKEKGFSFTYKFKEYTNEAIAFVDTEMAYNAARNKGEGSVVITPHSIPRTLNQALNDLNRIPDPAIRQFMSKVMGRVAIRMARIQDPNSPTAKATIQDMQAALREYGVVITLGDSQTFVISWDLGALIGRIQSEVEGLISAKKSA